MRVDCGINGCVNEGRHFVMHSRDDELLGLGYLCDFHREMARPGFFNAVARWGRGWRRVKSTVGGAGDQEGREG